MTTINQNQLFIHGELPANIFRLEDMLGDLPAMDREDIPAGNPLLFEGRVEGNDLDSLTLKITEAFKHLRTCHEKEDHEPEDHEAIVYWANPLPKDEQIIEDHIHEAVNSQKYGIKILGQLASKGTTHTSWHAADAQGRHFRLTKAIVVMPGKGPIEPYNNVLIYGLTTSKPAKLKKSAPRQAALI